MSFPAVLMAEALRRPGMQARKQELPQLAPVLQAGDCVPARKCWAARQM
jgi:hypothetical protein